MTRERAKCRARRVDWACARIHEWRRSTDIFFSTSSQRTEKRLHQQPRSNGSSGQQPEHDDEVSKEKEKKNHFFDFCFDFFFLLWLRFRLYLFIIIISVVFMCVFVFVRLSVERLRPLPCVFLFFFFFSFAFLFFSYFWWVLAIDRVTLDSLSREWQRRTTDCRCQISSLLFCHFFPFFFLFLRFHRRHRC